MASSPLPFPFPPTTTSYRAGAIFKFEMCQSAPRHPVLREIGCESVLSIHGGSGQGQTLRLNHRIVVLRRGETNYECVIRNWVTCFAFLLNLSRPNWDSVIKYCYDQSVQCIDVLVTYLLGTENGRKFTCQNCFVNVWNDSNLLRLQSSINTSSVSVVRLGAYGQGSWYSLWWM